MPTRKKCRTCRHYQPSPIRGQGWCRNPLLHEERERHLVSGGELACDRRFNDYWEAIPPPARQPGDNRPTARHAVLVSLPAVLLLALGVGGVYFSASSAPEPTVTPVLVGRTSTATTVPTVAPTPTRPAATPTPSKPERVRIGNTDGDGAYIRVEPVRGARGIVAHPDGTVLEVIGADRTTDGRTWRNVQDTRGNRGWVPADYLLLVKEGN